MDYSYQENKVLEGNIKEIEYIVPYEKTEFEEEIEENEEIFKNNIKEMDV